MTDRFDGHYARVLLHEARRFRHDAEFHAMLLRWAADARKRLAAKPVQRELFA